jgi:uncharacterized protein YjbI with pentapeptide repeats
MAITIAVNKVSNNISISTDDVVISTAEVVQPITVNTAIPSVVFDSSYLAVTPSGLVTATNVQGAIDQLAAVTEANDLSTAVTWADVPDANITESSVAQYITSANVSAAGAAMLTGADFTGDVTITNGELTVNGSAEADLFKGDIEGAVHFKGAVASGATLAKGDVVYVSGHSGQKTEVDLADASDSSKMPAFGIVAADPNGVNVDVVTFGTLKSINTSSYTDGDELYVSTTAGQLTATAPSGESNLVQKIAKVVRAHNSGNIKVMGAGRTNATPNLNNGNIFIGDSNNLATTASFATQVASAETSHADVVVDGDFTSAGIMTTDGSGVYSVDSSTYATETYVDTAVSNLVDSAPATLDTLNELASALGDDANFSTTVTTSIGTKWTEDATKISNWDTAYSWGDHSTEGYLTAETNDLSTTVTWANVPDANITESSVTQHQAALSITESQISDLQTYLTTHQDISGKANLSGASFTGNVNIGLPPSGTQSLTVAGNITAYGTVDGVDIAARDAVLTSTTSTANSAMQDLVDDTTPQLGGDLDLNGNDITGSGNVSITQTSTTVPALTLTSTDDGTVESPTMRLVRNSASQANADQIGQIEFYGKVGASAVREYAGIKAVLNDVTPASHDGQLDFYTRKNSSETKLMSLTPTALELTNGTDLDVAGDITVGGTVDGRDVATDGARLDTISYHRVKEIGLRSRYSNTLVLTTSYQDVGMFQDVIHPSTPVDCSRYLDLRLYIDWRYVSSGTNDLDLQIQFTVPSATTANLGSVTVLSPDPANHDTGNYQKWGYVSGDHTHHFTEFGKINKTGTASGSPMRVYSWYYNEALDRTYFLHDSNPGISLVNGDTVYWHPYDWESAGSTMIKDIEIDTRYLTFAHQTETHKVKIAYDDSRLTYRFKLKERSSSDSAVMDIASVTFTDVGEI